MKKLVLMMAFAFFASLGVTSASAADSPCCSAASNSVEEINDKSCDAFAPGSVAGCGELDADNCVGGGPVPSEDPQAQSPLGGCICVGGACVSDGSVGDTLASNGEDGDPFASDHECTRDAVAACCANDVCN